MIFGTIKFPHYFHDFQEGLRQK
ncbi:rCG54746 [Rattus norvegicus]|uniref:RCG54746 n=1 Tax=Rattus norvegicus TaxID=10116 RepID=A6KUD7_RAT|nr:rCG54746 [Rattus norvegicus]